MQTGKSFFNASNLFLAILMLSGNILCIAERPSYESKVVLFGNLHAHSKLSRDISGAGDEMLPIRAFEYAHSHGLDFLAISDHHKAPEPSRRLFMTANEYKTLLYDVAMKYNCDHPGQFIAIPGIEWGNIATGNHVNVFGAEDLPPDTILGTEYDELYEWSKENAEFVQFNHPYAWKGKPKRNRNETVGNFGEALYENNTEFVTAVDPSVKTISIICSVPYGHLTGAFRHSEGKTHRDHKSTHYNLFKNYLNMGFHISPAANQDTHHTNWGTVTAARTAAWANGASYNDLMAAFKANRTYATEDDELAVVFKVKYNNKEYWMGETVPLQSEEADVDLIIKIWQGVGSDGDPVDEGPYTVDVFSDYDGVGGRLASKWVTFEDIQANDQPNEHLNVVAGEYIYLQITEQNGKDNPIGEGDDEIINNSGSHGSDNKRDDMNDNAWTSPIWFTLEQSQYVWSKKSNVYHDSDCWAASRIGSANRRQDAIPPPDKKKHSCLD